MTARTWAAPAALGLASLCLLGSGVVVAGDLRADERKAAAARAAAREVVRAEAAYRDAVRPIAESVFDHAQPLVEADEQFDDDAVQGYFAWVDVATDPTAGKALQARRDELAALDAPPGLEAAGDKLDDGIEKLQEAAGLYRGLPFDPDDGRDLDSPARVALLRYNAGASAVNGALLDLYPDGERPPVPLRSDDPAKPARRPVSRGAYLLGVGRACGRGDERGDALPDFDGDPARARKAAKDSAVIVRDVVRDLLAVPKPPADAARLKADVDAQVARFGRLAESFELLARAAGTPDTAAIDRAFAGLDAADVPASRLEKAFKAYGSEACATFFEA